MTIAKAVLALRNGINQSQEVFSTTVGVSATSICKWENGRPPAGRHLQNLTAVATNHGIKHLAEFFEASRRATIATCITTLPSRNSARRITVSELRNWKDRLENLDGATDYRFPDLAVLIDEIQLHLEGTT